MADFLVVGGGIAGAGAGYFLSAHGTVTLLEMESAPGYHATGRSAALFSEYYGNASVRALTAASRPFFEAPPPGFAAHPLLAPRGVVALCTADEQHRFRIALAEGQDAPVPVREIDMAEVKARCPIVRTELFARAMFKPAAADIDVDALHRGFLRGITAAGGQVVTRTRVTEIVRRRGQWHAAGFAAPYLVNAAGAWADEVAAAAGARRRGLVPKRRTAFLVDGPAGIDAERWPMVADVSETFYLKPESGRLLVSPADATPAPAGDARPEDLDVAVGAQRIQEVTTLAFRRIHHAWAGLRTCAPGDVPVIGGDPDVPCFFWLAGLGGYGVQVAPAAGLALAQAVVDGTAADHRPPATARPV